MASRSLATIVLSIAGSLFADSLAWSYPFTLPVPGDVLIAQTSLGNVPGRVAVVRKGDSDCSLCWIPTDDTMVITSGIDIDIDGFLIIANNKGFSQRGNLVRIDPSTGARTVIEVLPTLGLAFFQPFGIEVDSDGSYVIAEQASQNIIRVSRQGVPSIISYVGSLAGIHLESDGTILAAETSTILRVNPSTGSQTVLSQGGFLNYPYALTTSPTGELIVTDFGTPVAAHLLGINPATGAQRLISTGGLLKYPYGVTMAPDGGVLVADTGAGGLVHIDLLTGAQSLYQALPGTLDVMVFGVPEINTFIELFLFAVLLTVARAVLRPV